MSQFYSDSIFWIEVEKIKPNPFQPRKEFEEKRLKDLADSIRMYGVLQPLVVTRKEIINDGEGLIVEYELISGERRLRASKLAGLLQVPVLIRATEDNDRVKLELAIIENLQREDLNAVERARAFERLTKEFNFKHLQVAEKIGKSREYVTNTLRILSLSSEILDALSQGKITEGHTRPLLMLTDRPEEQATLFREILIKKMNVREAENISRKIAFERARKKDNSLDPEIMELETKLTESLGTRVQIERKVVGGKVVIDYFTTDDLRNIIEIMNTNKPRDRQEMLKKHIALQNKSELPTALPEQVSNNAIIEENPVVIIGELSVAEEMMEAKSEEPSSDEDSDLYSMKNFSI
ncbi:MAG: ParB/RepB/Spo0J family partition protein [Candidatus Taylorbacteria bacterium]